MFFFKLSSLKLRPRNRIQQTMQIMHSYSWTSKSSGIEYSFSRDFWQPTSLSLTSSPGFSLHGRCVMPIYPRVVCKQGDVWPSHLQNAPQTHLLNIYFCISCSCGRGFLKVNKPGKQQRKQVHPTRFAFCIFCKSFWSLLMCFLFMETMLTHMFLRKGIGVGRSSCIEPARPFGW